MKNTDIIPEVTVHFNKFIVDKYVKQEVKFTNWSLYYISCAIYHNVEDLVKIKIVTENNIIEMFYTLSESVPNRLYPGLDVCQVTSTSTNTLYPIHTTYPIKRGFDLIRELFTFGLAEDVFEYEPTIITDAVPVSYTRHTVIFDDERQTNDNNMQP